MENLEAPSSPQFHKKLLLGESVGVGFDDSLKELRMPTTQDKERPVAKIDPNEGFCVKCRLLNPAAGVKDAKVFVNMMYDDAVPPPGDKMMGLSDEELAELLGEDSEDMVENLRVPMSLGQPRSEKDKSGEDCHVCDVVINTHFFDKAEASLIMKTFLITITLDGIEQKYELSLNRDKWVILKNKKYFGTKTPHMVRDCLVKEINEPAMGGMETPQSSEGELMRASSTRKITKEESTKSVKPQPVFEFIRSGAGFMTAKFQLSDVVGVHEVDLQMNDDRLVLGTPKHHLDVCLPVAMDFNHCEAVFDRESKVLLARVPIKSH